MTTGEVIRSTESPPDAHEKRNCSAVEMAAQKRESGLRSLARERFRRERNGA